jgi:YHS domain-containing protein
MNTTHQHYHARIKSDEAEMQPQFDNPGLEIRVVDPVCFMRVLTRSPFEAVHEGRKYHFCSEGCLREFRKDPGLYLPGKIVPILEKIKTFKKWGTERDHFRHPASRTGSCARSGLSHDRHSGQSPPDQT